MPFTDYQNLVASQFKQTNMYNCTSIPDSHSVLKHILAPYVPVINQFKQMSIRIVGFKVESVKIDNTACQT